MALASSKLFQPIQVGDITLGHHIALAPLTRYRANKAHVHGDLAVEYYTQRASVPGTLLIAEGTLIAAQAGGAAHAPGIWSDDQISAWRKITDSVHARGSFFYLQLWATGRAANPEQLHSEDPSYPYVSASDVPLTGRAVAPRALTVPEIKEYAELYATAASNAVHKAGFDGVEVHCANGYLIDQFLQDTSNKRTDEYGGSIENRSRFGLEVIAAVTKAVGEKKTGVRLSPWSRFQDMRMDDIEPTFTYFVTRLREQHPDLAYIHLIESRINGAVDDPDAKHDESNDFLRKIWSPRPFISAGAYLSPEEMVEAADKTGDIIAMGRHYISNPDLPARVKKGIAWAPYDRSTFYVPESPIGYIDYPFAEGTVENGRL